MYNKAGFDKFGNSSGAAGEDFDENGFSQTTPFNHNVTGTQFDSAGLHRTTRTLYDPTGFDKDGNSSGGSVAWTTTSSSFPITLTKGTGINPITLSATGVGTISYTYSGTFPSGIDLAGGSVSGNPNTVQAGTSVTITATDEDNNFNDLVVSFPAVTAGGSFDSNGFSTSFPFDHNVTGTQFDSEGLHRTTRTTRDGAGYNSAGYNVDGLNRADQWDASYDENDDVSGA
jgi:hypothetical protein